MDVIALPLAGSPDVSKLSKLAFPGPGLIKLANPAEGTAFEGQG